MREACSYPVHLVGSIPLRDTEDVFAAVSTKLDGCVSRIPDGETGERSQWLGFLKPALNATKGLDTIEVQLPPEFYERVLTMYRVADGVRPESVEFPALGYEAAALESFAHFQRLQQQRAISPAVKFQVSLATPLAMPASGFAPDHFMALEPAWTRAMRRELDGILAAIPHESLAIQWDTAVEVALLENLWPQQPLSGRRDAIVARLLDYIAWVPASIELGMHLCYGDSGGAHFKEPESLALLVDLANDLTAGAARPLQWLHMPVPRERDDDAYFEPLERLNLPGETTLYLGLIHDSDGAEGCRRRIAAAERRKGGFGVATECGFGRRDPQSIPALLDLHATVARGA